MSKLAYSEEGENGGNGWNGNFEEDLIGIDDNEVPSPDAEQPITKELASSIKEEARPTDMNIEPADLVPDAGNGWETEEIPLNIDEGVVTKVSPNDQEEITQPLSVPDPAVTVPPEPLSSGFAEEINSSQPTGDPINNFTSDLAASLPPIIAEKAQPAIAPPPPMHPITPSQEVTQTPPLVEPPPPVPVAEPLQAPPAVSSQQSAFSGSANLARQYAPPAVPSATSGNRSSLPGTQGGQRKLVLSQAQIKYKQPVDYAAVLANAAKATAKINQARSAAGAYHSKPITTVTNSSVVAAAAVIAKSSSQRPSKNVLNSYPTSMHKTPTSTGMPQYSRGHPAQVPQNFGHTAPPPPAVTRSATVPDMIEPSQQQPYQQDYYNEQRGTNGDGYTSEQDDQGKHRTKTSEKRRSKKSRRDRTSNVYQAPVFDAYQMYGMIENPQSYQEYYNQWYMQQARMAGYYSGASTPAASSEYGDGGSEYGGDSRSRPSSRMSLQGGMGAYPSPQTANPYAGYDATAWWYWYWQQQQQMQQTQMPPQRPSTPKKFAYPHCRASFSASGFLVTVVPGRNAYVSAGVGSPATKVNLIRTSDLLSLCIPESKEFCDFPGPLVPNESHKVDVINFAQRMSQQALASDYIDKDSVNLLWRFIELLVRQNGTYYGADVAHLLTEALPGLPEQLIEPADLANVSPEGSIQQLRNLLLHGRKREAVDFAMSRNLWAHAMFLSHSISEQYFLTVRNRFLAASAAPGDPLATFYQLATLSSPVISRQAVVSDMHSWRQHLAVILSNSAVQPQFHRQLLLSLGDTLRSQGRLYAAQLCYLMAGDQFSTFPPPTSADGFSSVTRLILLGSEPCDNFLQLAKPYFCQLTEIYEYCTRLANPRAILPYFQIFKAYYSLCLAEMGFVHEAFRYLMSVIEGLQIAFASNPQFGATFPRVCFKWLCDLFTALHKSEPAVDFSSVEWIFRAAEGKPIQPPPLQPQFTNVQQQPQQHQQIQQPQQSHPDMFRQMNQTPGPNQFQQPISTYQQPQQPLQPPQPDSHQQGLSNQSTVNNSQFQQQQQQQPASETTPRPFDTSRRFDRSVVSHRSDGTDSDQPNAFGSSNVSLTSITKNLNDMRKTAMNFAHQDNADGQLSEKLRQPPMQPRVSESAASDDTTHSDAPPPTQPQQYVSPLTSWQPNPAIHQPSVDPAPSVGQPSLSNGPTSASPPPQNNSSPLRDQSSSDQRSAPGVFDSLKSRLFGGTTNSANKPYKMLLPDDKKPALVWDEGKKKWVDTTKGEGEDDEDEAPPPPPPMMAAPAMSAAPPPAVSAPSAVGGPGRFRSRYVDVLKPQGGSAVNGSALLRPAFQPQAQPQKFFVPPPVPDSN